MLTQTNSTVRLARAGIAHLSAQPSVVGVGLFGFVALALLMLLLTTSAETAPWGPGVSVTIAALLFALHLALVAGRVSPFDPVVWFPIAMLLFYFGRAMLIAWFGIVPFGGYDPWQSGGGPWIDRGYMTSLLNFAAALTGIHAVGIRSMVRVDHTAPSDRTFEVAAFWFALGSAMMLAAGIAIAGPSTVFGFYDQWYAAKLGSTDQRFIEMGVPFTQAAACALVASASRSARWRRFAAIALFTLTCGIALAKGDRTSVIAFGVGAGWVYTQRVGRVRWPAVAALAFTAMVAMPLVAEYRASRSLAATNTAPARELVSRTIAEMGISGTAIVYTEKLVPERQDYSYGATFLLAAYELIPNVGLTKRLAAVDAPISWNPAYWLAWILDANYAASGGGFGFSMAAEWYYNFGILGVWIGGLLIGYVVAKARNDASRSPLALVWSATLFAGASIWVRNVVGFPIRVAVWPLFGLWAIYRILKALRGSGAAPRARKPLTPDEAA